MSEIWKPIKGYETHYEISSHGRVKALYREFVGKDGRIKKYHERFLKPDTSEIKRGYMRVTLSKDYKTQRFLVHRLVAEHFIPNPENKPFINHIDNNGLNNNISNLEWCTHSENMIHAQKQGRLFNSQSKGGKIGGQIAKDKMLAYFNTIKGTTINFWYIDSISSDRRYDNMVDVNVVCTLCNTKKIMSLQYIKHNISTSCNSCRKKAKEILNKSR